MIARNQFLEELISFKDKDLIKVVTGIRRCGKSTLFEIYIDYLKQNGVEENQIVHINLAEKENSHLREENALYNYLISRLLKEKMTYYFVDEVQMCIGWETAIDSLYIKKTSDVYITGSNAYLLSGELATLLSGRYVEIKMFPLSFAEYISAFDDSPNLENRYNDYITKSSFPYALKLSQKKDISAYLEGIINSIVLKDVMKRKKITDVAMLESVIDFTADNIGNLTSTKSISDTMTSNGRKIAVQTVENYLSALCDSYIFYKIGRYDIKGKEHLKTGDKYYISDIALRFHLLGNKSPDFGRILENIVALELMRRGYKIGIGKVGNTEVDFVATTPYDGTEYYQVAFTVREKSTLARELTPLDSISDHNPKFLLTMDNDPVADHNGIKQLYVLDWLLDK